MTYGKFNLGEVYWIGKAHAEALEAYMGTMDESDYEKLVKFAEKIANMRDASL